MKGYFCYPLRYLKMIFSKARAHTEDDSLIQVVHITTCLGNKTRTNITLNSTQELLSFRNGKGFLCVHYFCHHMLLHIQTAGLTIQI